MDFPRAVWIAVTAANDSTQVTAAWAMGVSGPNVAELIATPAGTRVLPNNKLRINVGQSDVAANQVDLSGLQAIIGDNCGMSYQCLQGDGSGYYVVSNAEVADGGADHCYCRFNLAERLSTYTFMSQPGSTKPARRADAERNREKILVAARTAFADPQAEISMAGISRRAGVGMATLYRNFPSRLELLEALYTEEVDAICAAAKTLDAGTPGAMLTEWLHRFFAYFKNKHHIASELLQHTDSNNRVFSSNRDRLIVAGRPLLVAAQRAHEVRDDLALEQILDMIIAIATIHGEPGYLEPILQATTYGLRPMN